MLDQNRAPLYSALLEYRSNRVVPFDVPGHKQGRGNPDLVEFLGRQCLSVDVNSMKPLDNLSHPVSVIKEAEELAAQAFQADHAFFMVNGASSGVQAMIMSVCHQGDRIIMPRNVHKSAINALILSGAIPIYVNPGLEQDLGISLGMSVKDVKSAVQNHPEAKAVLVNNPTYYGVCADLGEIVKIAHEAGMMALVDEAHGTHFYFGQGLPPSAMELGADMSTVSTHKTGGSLTQSAILLLGKGANSDYVRQIINLTQTTSSSYLLLSSLDITRRNLALQGREIYAKVNKFAAYAREEVNKIGGFYAFGKELAVSGDFFDFDSTKLAINTRNTGLAGIEVYDILRDEYGIQIEFGDILNCLAIISVGDRALDIERLISALSEIKRLKSQDPKGMPAHEYLTPTIELSPQAAFFAKKETRPIESTEQRICGEFVMCYPPGIPILAPGERITKDILANIAYAKAKGCFLTGTEDLKIENLKVLEV